MGDDNEIRQVVRRESEEFLDEARRNMADKGKIYNLDEEFKKTKKNRSTVVYVATLITIAALAGVAYIATGIINKQTAAMPVDVNAFQDLNLKDLLDRAKRDESNLEQAKLDLSRIASEQQSSLDAIDRDTAAAEDAIRARGLSRAEEKRRIAQADASAASQKKAVRDGFAASLASKQAEVKSMQAKVDSYDQRLSDQNRKQQELLDNQNKLFEIEKGKLVGTYEGKIQDLSASIKKEEAALKRQREDLASSYTARWNPTFDDAASVALLHDSNDVTAGSLAAAALPDKLYASGVLNKADSAKLDASYQNALFLSAKLRAIPYLNSVPPALARMEYEARYQFFAYHDALAKAGAALDERDQKIADLQTRLTAAESNLDHYRWATSQYVLENRDGGYIVDARDPKELFIALNPAISVTEGTSGSIIRQSDKTIATITFYSKGGQMRARLVSIVPGETLKAFDPIIVFVPVPTNSGETK